MSISIAAFAEVPKNQAGSDIPGDLKGRNQILATVAKHGLTSPSAFDSGVLARAGHAHVYMSSLEETPDWDRLYWSMVRVLSEKYACFMTRKVSNGNLIRFNCRDGRQVVFRRGMSNELIFFNARQYNLNGDEIFVKNHQIYLVSEAP